MPQLSFGLGALLLAWAIFRAPSATAEELALIILLIPVALCAIAVGAVWQRINRTEAQRRRELLRSMNAERE